MYAMVNEVIGENIFESAATNRVKGVGINAEDGYANSPVLPVGEEAICGNGRSNPLHPVRDEAICGNDRSSAPTHRVEDVAINAEDRYANTPTYPVGYEAVCGNGRSNPLHPVRDEAICGNDRSSAPTHP